MAGLYDTADGAANARLVDRTGRCQASLGQFAAAETTHRRALSVRAKMHGPKHAETLTSMNEVAQTLSDQAKYAEAEKMHCKTLSSERRY